MPFSHMYIMYINYIDPSPITSDSPLLLLSLHQSPLLFAAKPSLMFMALFCELMSFIKVVL